MATLNFLTDNLDEAKECLEKAESMCASETALMLALVYLNLRRGETA
jgi:hypothetical protein